MFLTTRAAGTWYSVETFSDANDTALTDHIATPLAWDNHGIPQVSLSAGADETVEHDIFVSGMQEGDIVIKVLVLTTAASTETITAHPGTHTAKNGGIDISSEVDNTGNRYLIFWIDTHEP